jgi:hypothetical protein
MHRTDDFGDLWCVSVKESLDQPGSLGRLLVLENLPTNANPGKNSSSQESKGQNTSDPMPSPRPFHHLPLRFRPVPPLYKQADVRPLQGRRQMAVLGPGVSERGTFRQPQLRPSATGLALLASQPVPQ